MIEDSIGKIELCDGCGWKKRISLVDNFGNGFCRDCVEDKLIEYHNS